jgi:NAD-reducing hydrogenase large subunit
VAIRAYDLCLSCATHAVEQLPLELVFLDAGGNEVARCPRD